MNPLKFLDAYQREDLQFFFGRELETEELYSKVRRSRLFVLYGLSGTGKTSVVRCGLANRFDPVDCLEIYVRRETHMLKAMRKCIQELADTFIPQRTDHVEALRILYVETLRPIFLIFDQFEEIFISGHRDEVDEFCRFLSAVLSNEAINANILIIIREEYMGQLEKLETCAPTIYQNKQRLERMTFNTVHDVVKKILRFGGLTYSDPDIPKLIVENAGARNDSIELPYLQVYLDRLFGIAAPEGIRKGVVLTKDHVNRVGKLEELLGDFLEKQLAIIRTREKDKDTEFGWRVLKSMITPEATKKVVTMSSLIAEVFNDAEPSPADERKLQSYLGHLKHSRLIRMMGDDRVEIAHDTLGPEIAKKRTPEELKILESERIVRSKYLSLKANLKDYLTNEQIRYIQPYEPMLKLDTHERRFLQDNIRRNKRKRRFLKFSRITTIVVLVGITIWALIERNKAEHARSLAEAARTTADEERIKAENERIAANASKLAADAARVLADSQTILATSNREKAEQFAEQLIQKSKEREEALKEARRNALDAFRSGREAIAARNDASERAKQATRERNRTESINLAFQSTLESDSVERSFKALKAYYLNAQFNDNQWSSEIVTALAYSNAMRAMRALPSLDAPLMDFLGIRGAVIAITDLGKFEEVNPLNGKRRILSNFKDYHYLRNSARFDSDRHSIFVRDTRKNIYEFSAEYPLFRLLNQESHHGGDSILMMRGDYLLSISGVSKQGNPNSQLVKFVNRQCGSQLEVHKSTNTIAAGTADGWLYIWQPDKPAIFKTQFQEPGTSVLDIAFDSEADFIATGGTDSRFRLGRVKTIFEKLPFFEWRFDSWVTALLFVSDRRVLVGTSNGSMFLFDYDQDRLASGCCEQLKAQLLSQRRTLTDSLVIEKCLGK